MKNRKYNLNYTVFFLLAFVISGGFVVAYEKCASGEEGKVIDSGKCYCVKRGDILSRLANRFDTNYNKLAEINGITNPNLIFIGQKICFEEKKPIEKIKEVISLVSEEIVLRYDDFIIVEVDEDEIMGRDTESCSPGEAYENYYCVKKRDVLSKIAFRFGTTFDELAEINNIDDPDKIFVGQKIYFEKETDKEVKKEAVLEIYNDYVGDLEESEILPFSEFVEVNWEGGFLAEDFTIKKKKLIAGKETIPAKPEEEFVVSKFIKGKSSLIKKVLDSGSITSIKKDLKAFNEEEGNIIILSIINSNDLVYDLEGGSEPALVTYSRDLFHDYDLGMDRTGDVKYNVLIVYLEDKNELLYYGKSGSLAEKKILSEYIDFNVYSNKKKKAESGNIKDTNDFLKFAVINFAIGTLDKKRKDEAIEEAKLKKFEKDKGGLEQIQVLLVTTFNLDMDNEFDTALEKYRKIIRKEGLNSEFVILDSEEAIDKYKYGGDWNNFPKDFGGFQECYGKSTPEECDPLRVKYNVEIRDAIRTIYEYYKKNTGKGFEYLILLGGDDVLPLYFFEMDECMDENTCKADSIDAPMGFKHTYMKSYDGKLVSDDGYAMMPKGKLMLSRMPTMKGDMSSKLVTKQLITNGNNRETLVMDNSFVLSDSCGMKKDCWIKDYVDANIENHFGSESCESYDKCRVIPTVCPLKSSGRCTNSKTFYDSFNDAESIIIAAHGRFPWVAILAKPAKGPGLVITSDDYESDLNLKNNPIVFSNICHGAALDIPDSLCKQVSNVVRPNGVKFGKTYGYECSNHIEKFINSGARAFVGPSRLSDPYMGSLFFAYHSGKVFGSPFKNYYDNTYSKLFPGDNRDHTLGEIMREIKDNRYLESSRLLMLYGDPTQKVRFVGGSVESQSAQNLEDDDIRISLSGEKDLVIDNVKMVGVYTVVLVHTSEIRAINAYKQVNPNKKIIYLTDRGKKDTNSIGLRNVEFALGGTKYKLDPNNLFSEKGIENEFIEKYGLSKWNSMEDGGDWDQLTDNIDQLTNPFVAEIFKDEKPLLVLYQNYDGGFGINSYVNDPKFNKYASEVYVNSYEDPDDFVYVNTKNLFNLFKNNGVNVVLQNNDLSFDDGSLSYLATKRGYAYVNIEGEQGKTERNRKMISVFDSATQTIDLASLFSTPIIV